MRLVAVDCLIGGELIARDIIRENGVVLLKKNTIYKQSFKQKLLDYNISSIYIEDSISEGIEPVELITQEKRILISQDLKEEVSKIKTGGKINAEGTHYIAEGIIENINHQNLVYDVVNIKTNDESTYDHSIGVTLLAYIVCRKLNLPLPQIKDILVGSLLHDIGKLFIPKEILTKESKLTEHEFQIIKQHPTIGYNLIKDDATISAISKVTVLCHHEREDGSGYPLGKGADVHIGAKITACCDVFDATTTERCYRKAMHINEAIVTLHKEKLNPVIRTALESILNFYPVGAAVLLSNGSVGIVEKNYAHDLISPIVRVVFNKAGSSQTFERLDLSKNKDISIIQRLGDVRT